jgi:phosphohistidine swiveling domain-containing protein
VGAITFGYLALTSSRRRHVFLLLYALSGVLLFFLTAELRAAVNLYLVINLSALLVQGIALRLLPISPQCRGTGRETTLSGSTGPSVIPLKDAHRIAGTGNKAHRLAQMLKAGLPVPDGFVITDKVLWRGDSQDTSERLNLTPAERRRIARLWRKLRVDRVAVRSSGLNEDSPDRSYAGVFESVLNVGRDELLDAIETVRASLRSHRSAAYGGNSEERGAVLVQRMVDADYAGVLFTEHPASAGQVLIEVVPGLGEALVSGRATPEAYRFGRVSGRALDPKKAPLDFSPLLKLGREVEKLFGRPQDIEWAFCGGRFMLLQARDITASTRKGVSARSSLEREKFRLLEIASAAGPQEIVLAQNELSEVLPRPTPVSLSLMERLWAAGGSTDLACRALGIPYEVGDDSSPYLVTAFGALYINRQEERRRLTRAPGTLAAFRLSRAAERIEREFRSGFLPGFLEQARLWEALELYHLSVEDLVHLTRKWTRRFVKETYVQADIINLAADFYWKTASRELRRRDIDPALYLGKAPPTVIHQAMDLLLAIRKGERPLRDFLEFFGHRAPQDYELSQPRYRESPALVQELISRMSESTSRPEQPMTLPKDTLLAIAVRRAQQFAVLKEEAKHHCLRELANLRRVLVELDSRLELDNGIFYLTLDEIARLQDEEFLDQALELIDRRRREADIWKDVHLPTEFSVTDLENMDTEGTVAIPTERRGVLRGTRVSGEGVVAGRVRIIRNPADVDAFRKGEILVARFTEPAWAPLFPKAKAIITEVGGWLSHAAIVAREYNIPAALGTVGALDALETGQLVRLAEDGTIEKVADRRRHERIPMAAKVSVMRHGALIEAVLRDLSRSGALIELNEELMQGEDVDIRISTGGGELRAQVIRHDASGGYGLRFSTPLGELPPADVLALIQDTASATEPDQYVPEVVEIPNWPPKRKAGAVLDILKGKTTMPDLCQRYGLPHREVEGWLDEALRGIEESLAAPQREIRRQRAGAA